MNPQIITSCGFVHVANCELVINYDQKSCTKLVFSGSCFSSVFQHNPCKHMNVNAFDAAPFGKNEFGANGALYNQSLTAWCKMLCKCSPTICTICTKLVLGKWCKRSWLVIKWKLRFCTICTIFIFQFGAASP